MVFKFDDYFCFNEMVLNLWFQCQQVLVFNIVNVDMFNYKVCDVNFVDVFKNVLDNKFNMILLLQLECIVVMYVVGIVFDNGLGSIGGIVLQYCMLVQGSVDGNMVDMDVECNEFLDNGICYEVGVIFVNGQIKVMLNVI